MRIAARRWLSLVGLTLTALAGAAVAAETGRIGVSVTDLGNPFFVRVARGVESCNLGLPILDEVTREG